MKLAVIYTRVSTDEQAERGYSLPHQLSECRRYAALNGFSVVKEIYDDYSGATVERPGFLELREFISQNRVDAIVVYTADRLSRNIVDFLVLRDQWEKAGIELHYVDRGKSQNNFEGLLTDGIFALLAHGERLKITERTSNGRHNKAKNNHIVMTGIPPYGYKKSGEGRDAEYVIDPLEAEAVRSIFEWYVAGYGNKGPISLRAISNVLDQVGIVPPNNRVNRASFWHPNSIAVILKNSIYMGITYYGKVRIENGKRIPRPKEEWTTIHVPHLAVVSKDIFEAAQVRLLRNKELAKRNRKGEYLLSGHFRCGRCGSVMAGYTKTHPKQKPVSFYRCGHHKGGICQDFKSQISMKRVDTFVWCWVTSLLEDENNLYEGIRAMIEKAKREWGPKQGRLETIESLLSEADTKIARLIDELSEYEGYAVRDVIREKIKAIEGERAMLSEEGERLARELEQSEISPDIEQQIKRTAVIIREKLSGSTYEEKRIVLDALDMRVEYIHEADRGDILRVSCVIPFADEEIALSSSRKWWHYLCSSSIRRLLTSQ